MYKQEEGIVLKGSLFPPLLHEQEKQTEEDEDGYFFSLSVSTPFSSPLGTCDAGWGIPKGTFALT